MHQKSPRLLGSSSSWPWSERAARPWLGGLRSSGAADRNDIGVFRRLAKPAAIAVLLVAEVLAVLSAATGDWSALAFNFGATICLYWYLDGQLEQDPGD